MDDRTDPELLRAYAEDRSEAAFAELVRRHLDFVYSAALRMVRDSHLAEDVTQTVFVALAKGAGQLVQRPVLSGWLHRTAQNIAAHTVRTIQRRRAREQEAVAMNELLSGPDSTWEQIAPQLDAALGELSEVDRDALLFRYFERKSAREMAQAFGISDEAAQKRVNRAVERLRELFNQRGVTVGASGLVLISANAVQAAPVGLAATVSTAAGIAGTTIQAATAIAATKAIAMTTLQKTLAATAVAVLAGVGIYEIRQASRLKHQNETLQQQQTTLAEKSSAIDDENRRLSNVLAAAMQPEGGVRIEPANVVATRETISLSELEGKLRAAAALPDQQRQSAISAIGSSIDPRDSAKAIGIANAVLSSYSDRDVFLRSVLRVWAEVDPKSAAEFVMTLPANGVRQELLQSTMGTWAKADPDAAIKFADALPAGSGRDWALCYAAFYWSGKDAAAAWNWARSLPEGETRVLSLQAVLRQLATSAPDEAANYAVQLSGDEQVRAIRALITDSAVSNPTWTADWVHQFPAGDARDKAVEMLVKRWAERDPLAASDWLLKQPQDKGYQDGAKQLISKVLKVSPELAWDWAGRVTDEKIRKQQQQYVAKQWLGLDQAAARTKIQASGLPTEEISKLLAP